MSEQFITIINMSLKASYVIILVMLIRLLLKKAPKFLSYALWGVVAFRLIIPFSFESIFSIIPEITNTNPIPYDIIYQERPELRNGTELVDTIENNAFTESNAVNRRLSVPNEVTDSLPVPNDLVSSLPEPDATASVNPIQIYILIGACLWALGIVTMIVYSLISVIGLRRRLKNAQLIEEDIYEAHNLGTPFVLGLIMPRIYLPAGLKTDEREYILHHERTHIRRKDHIIKIIAFLILSIHWFNPLVWIAFVLMSTDMELSCDERVLREMKEDVKGPYANSLLSLAMGRHIINGSPLAFGEGNVKGRIKNVLNYKKPSFWMLLVSIIAVIIISLALIADPKQKDIIQKDDINIDNLNQNDNVSEDYNNEEDNVSESSTNQDNNISEGYNNQDSPKPENSSQLDDYEDGDPTVTADVVNQTEYSRVKIRLISGMLDFLATNEFETTNYRMVAYIDTILRGGERVSGEDDLISNITNKYQIILSNQLSESSCGLYYDTLNNKAYFEKNNGLYEVDVGFARYIDSFLENTNIDVNIDDTEALALFNDYGWTLNYKINSMEQKINNINSLSGFNANAYYFAYNNELSKDIGLDMSGYSNSTDIVVDIYRINESMPAGFYPIQNARAIVVKSGDKIIGAFISAGRHSAFNACSLKGNSFEKVTGKNLNEWLTDMVIADEFEEGISTLEPEQVIEEYFLALDRKDSNAAQYYISRASLLGNLTSNMLNEELYNERVSLPLTGIDIGARSLSNLESAKLLKVEPAYGPSSNILIFNVTVDIRYLNEDVLSINSGEQFWSCFMIYESPQTGWKIVEFGH